MRLEWLEDILAVAETGSFSEAAERRRLTQSAFSRRIQNIEDYVGTELFDRTHKPVQLRPTTEDQRDQIARLATRLRQLLEDLKRGERISGNRIILASQHALTTALTPVMIQGLQAEHEDLHIRLRSANLDDCFAMLLARQADIALVYRVPGEEHPLEADYIESITLGTDRLIPVVGTEAGDALNTRFAEGQLPFIAYPGEVFLGKVMDRFVLPRVRGMSRAIPRVETALTLAALEMAAVGLGVAWVPASLAEGRIASGKLADLSNSLPTCALNVTAVRLAGNSGAVEMAVWKHFAAMSI